MQSKPQRVIYPALDNPFARGQIKYIIILSFLGGFTGGMAFVALVMSLS